jgi:type IV pilus assembly protein PilQ
MEEVSMKKGIFLLMLAINSLIFSSSIFANTIKGINFIQEGEISKLIVNIDGKEVKAERFHVAEDKQIILDIKNVKFAKNILRPIDTSEFSGSIVLIKPYLKPGTKDELRIAIQLRDNVRSVMELQGNKITLNVENRFGVFSKDTVNKAEDNIDQSEVSDLDKKYNVPKSDAIEDILENITLSGVKKYIGKKISINVKSIPVNDILNFIAEMSGFNIIIDQDVEKRNVLTLSLTNLPWDETLDTILSLSKLVAKKHNNILMVTTFEKAQTDREAELRNSQLGIKQESLVTKIFPISFSKLDDIKTILQEYSTPERGRITSDERTNSLIVKDTVEVIEKMKKIIGVLDTATPQILIEAKIVEANERYSKSIGLDASSGFQANYGNGTGTNDTAWNFNSIGGVGDNGATLGVALTNFGKFDLLGFNLQLMESESKGRIVSSPKVITQNKMAATFTSTDTISFITSQASDNGTSTTVNNVDASLNLSVTPQVTNDGSIAMEVSISKTGFTTSATADSAPDTSSRAISTNVLVDNGSTIVIGGLYKTESSETVQGIPFLKDLPLVGWLFRSAYSPTNNRNELIIFLTPRIINQEEAGLVDREQTLDT